MHYSVLKMWSSFALLWFFSLATCGKFNMLTDLEWNRNCVYRIGKSKMVLQYHILVMNSETSKSALPAVKLKSPSCLAEIPRVTLDLSLGLDTLLTSRIQQVIRFFLWFWCLQWCPILQGSWCSVWLYIMLCLYFCKYSKKGHSSLLTLCFCDIIKYNMLSISYISVKFDQNSPC